MKNELLSLEGEWQEHFNTHYYEGSWTALALRSPGGSSENIIPDMIVDSVYLDTPLMEHFSSVKELLATINCPVMAVRFLNLKAGAVIKQHRDNELAFEKGEARLHFPVITNPGVKFYIENEPVPLKEGDCWYVNANLPHRVLNEGATDRIHLVIDCTVNDWLKNMISLADDVSLKEETASADLLNIILELRLQNTQASNILASKLEEQSKGNTQKNHQPLKKLDGLNDFPLKNWIPYKLVNHESHWLCHWLNTFGEPFTEPFFDETILKCRTIAGKHSSMASVSELTMLEEWGDRFNTIEPAAFIFHISRCGSTLIAQLLATSNRHTVLSEVPFFDNLLRLPKQDARFNTMSASNFLRSAINYYGQKKIGQEQHVFIKADSWHIFFYEQLRELYPTVPFILMYRRPDEVFNSHKKLPGMQAVPGLIEPEVFGFSSAAIDHNDPDQYLAMVLESYLNKYHSIMKTDQLALLINYNEGAMTIIQKIAAFTNTPISRQTIAHMEDRSRYHSKKPNEVFSEMNHPDAPQYLDRAMEIYYTLEQKGRVIRK